MPDRDQKDYFRELDELRTAVDELRARGNSAPADERRKIRDRRRVPRDTGDRRRPDTHHNVR